MLNAVIAMNSDDLYSILKDRLDHHFSVTCCRDGQTALQLLKDIRPEILILDLSLQLLDGISMLEQCADCRPPIILAAIDVDNDYVRDVAQDVGIGYMIKLPWDVNAIVTRLLDMVHRHNKTKRRQEAHRTQTAELLLELAFATKRDGYTYLQAAIPMFADDPEQKVCMELYPPIAKMLNGKSGPSVEHAIRTAIEDAWARRNPEVWEKYFPEGSVKKNKGPSNKEFISRMAEELNRR